MNGFHRFLSLILAVVLMGSTFGGTHIPRVSAAETQNLATLLNDGKIKALGRTVSSADGSCIHTDWSGTGFEMNVFASTETTLTVHYKANYDTCWVVLVDGEQVWRDVVKSSSSGASFEAPIPYGTHTVSVIRETGLGAAASYYHSLTSISFDGTILTAPKNEALYIEFIGDSYSCGSGALGVYSPGMAWSIEDHSATHGFPWYTAQTLKADYSIIARGGIGLFRGASAQEGTVNYSTMADIYPNISGHNTANGTYDFTSARKPDIVVVELGANDAISTSDTTRDITAWKTAMGSFTTQIRNNYPDAAIVCLSQEAAKHQAIMQLCETSDNMYALYYAHNGNGSAAVAGQMEGHPSWQDHQQIAKTLVNFLRYNDLIPGAEAEPSYNDIEYYVSESGSDSNTGSTREAALKSVPKAFAVAKANTFGENDRIVINVQGTVVGTSSQRFALDETIQTASGKNVPILIQTDNYDGQTKATLQISLASAKNATMAVTYCTNDITFRNVTLYSPKNSNNWCIYQFYSAGFDLEFDNTALEIDQSTTYPTDKKWQVGTANCLMNQANVTKFQTEDVYSTVTFRNGDYTNLIPVAAIMVDSVYNATNATFATALPGLRSKLVIEDGAKMGTVYGMYGNLQVGSCTVEINGGEIDKYIGSNSNKSYSNGLTTKINGGVIRNFRGLGDTVTVTGDVNNIMTGGEILMSATTANDSVYFGGGKGVTVNGNITNNISGGAVSVTTNAAVACEIVFGCQDATKITGGVTNTISGGSFAILPGTTVSTSAHISLGHSAGTVLGTLKNEIAGGTFYTKGNIYFGGKGVRSVYRKIENILGAETAPGSGPRFYANVYMGGNWGQIGISAYTSTGPSTVCSDEVVLSNTIYGGYFGVNVYAGIKAPSYDAYYGFVQGSIENNLYGGVFPMTFLGGCYTGCDVFGKITTNVYGGNYANLRGASGTVHDGVVLNLVSMNDFYVCKPTAGYQIIAGTNGGSISTQTENRPAVELIIKPDINDDLVLETPIYMNGTGTVTGSTTAAVFGGTFTNGFAISGKTVKEALAEGCYCIVDGAVVTPASDDATSVAGAVTVKPIAAMVGTVPYDTLADALKAVGSTGTVKLGADTSVETLRISAGASLDLNGKLLTAQDVLCFGDLTDSSVNGTGGIGGIIISSDTAEAIVHLQADNSQLPVYDTANGCYRFFSYEHDSLGSYSPAAGTQRFGFRLLLDNPDGYALLRDSEDSCVHIEAELALGNSITIPYVYSADQLRQYASNAATQVETDGSVRTAFFLAVTGLSALGENDVLTVTPKLDTVSGITLDMAPMVWQKTAE